MLSKQGNLSEVWSAVTKAGIAEAVLSLTKLEEDCRTPPDCLRTPSVWLTLAALCLLQDEHVERLSSTQWARGAVNKVYLNTMLMRFICRVPRIMHLLFKLLFWFSFLYSLNATTTTMGKQGHKSFVAIADHSASIVIVFFIFLGSSALTSDK